MKNDRPPPVPPDPRRRWLALGLLALAGCMQQMARQPAFRPLQGTDFFPDGRSARPLVPGTLPGMGRIIAANSWPMANRLTRIN